MNVAVVSVGYPVSADQTKFGPWQAIADWLTSAACTDNNPATTSVLDRDFDTMQPDWEK